MKPDKLGKTLEDLRTLMGAFVVWGGAAVYMHGYDRKVRDVDLLVLPYDYDLVIAQLLGLDWEIKVVEADYQCNFTKKGCVPIDVIKALPDEEHIIRNCTVSGRIQIASVPALIQSKAHLSGKKHEQDIKLLRRVRY